MKKRILSSLAIIGLALLTQSCAIHTYPYGHSVGFYGYGPYFGLSYGYSPYRYYGYRPYYRPYYRGYKPYYRHGYRDYDWGSRYKGGSRRSWGGGGFGGLKRR